MQWRWEQFVKGKPVRRTTEFLKSRQIPKYLLLPSEPCIVFPSTHVLHIPLNVWSAHILPNRDADDAIKAAIRGYSCIDYAKTYPEYVKEQKRARQEDEMHETLLYNGPIKLLRRL